MLPRMVAPTLQAQVHLKNLLAIGSFSVRLMVDPTWPALLHLKTHFMVERRRYPLSSLSIQRLTFLWAATLFMLLSIWIVTGRLQATMDKPPNFPAGWESQRRRSKRPQFNADCSWDVAEDYDLGRDGPGPISRSSVTHVAYIISKFDETKKELVRQIGFQGLLDLPHIAKVDRKFTVWLLSKLDPETRTFVVNGQCVVDIVDFEVALIMGIPCGSRTVSELEGADRKKKLDFIQHCIGSDGGETNNLVAAGANVAKKYPSPMTKEEMDKFKVSFVVWVMGHLLAPTKHHNIGSDSFWGALTKPDDIKLFNWADFVLEELVTAAVDVQAELKQRRNVASITGCPILLQILYFEAINMGALNAPRKILPRVKAYDSKIISSLIEADKACSASNSENATWGSNLRLKPRISASLHQTSNHPSSEGMNDMPDEPVVQKFSKVVRDSFGDKLSPAQLSAFNWFNARCVHHLSEMNRNIEKDTILLIHKLMPIDGNEISSPQPLSVPRSIRHDIRSHLANRPAQSEPWKQSHGKRVAGFQYKQQAKKTNCARSANVGRYAQDSMTSDASDSAEHSVFSNGNAAEATYIDSNFAAPSFDLGIDLSPPRSNPEAPLPTSKPSNQCLDADSLSLAATPANVIKMLPGTPASAINYKPTMCRTPDHRFHNSSSSPGTLAKILAEGALVDRMVVLEEKIDINSAPWDHDFSDSPISKRPVVPSSMASSPWSQNYYHRIPPKDIVDQLFEDVRACGTAALDSPWILHKEPRVIQLDGRWIQSILVNDKPLSYDVCDLLMRRLVQLDLAMYQEDRKPPWRLFLESEFAMLALAGEPAFNRKSIRKEFLGQHISFNIEECQMIVVPALILLNWCCYFFDFKERAIHVIDPLFNAEQSLLFHELHNPNVSKIAAALCNCIDTFFEGWDHRINEWEARFVMPPILYAATHETGLLSVLYAREFDGLGFHNTSRESFAGFKRSMLYEILSLENNQVKPPISFTISIED
ncbi:hypothetical protein BS78_10G250400 [Paspalum vaginatum]|nr:hypothetical protein BS78_10G250400 [Paspalum vaginatum]